MSATLEPTTSKLRYDSLKVLDPLRSLRGYIRFYVVTEAFLMLLVYLAVLCWIGVGIDWGCYALFGFDWAKETPRWVRGTFVALGLMAVVFFVEVLRSLLVRRTNRRTGRESIATFLSDHHWIIFAIFAGVSAIIVAVWAWMAAMRESGSLSSLAVGLIILGLLLVFVVMIIVKRFLYEFSDPALALLLERRFPKLLGDRLITAVEMSDPRVAARYGYSPVMVEKTIHDAAERVDQIHVSEVFNWGRLIFKGALAFLMTIGVYLAAAGTMMGVAAANDQPLGWRQVAELNDSSLRWAQRNLLLDRELWPMRHVLMLPEFTEKSVMRVQERPEGKERVTKVTLRAAALQYIIHDSEEDDSWRPMTLSDAGASRFELSAYVSPKEFPKTWYPRNPKRGWMVDDLNRYLDAISMEEKANSKTIELPPEGVLKKLYAMRDEIDALFDSPSHVRELRRLEAPSTVTMHLVGTLGTRGKLVMDKQNLNEFKAELDLKPKVKSSKESEDLEEFEVYAEANGYRSKETSLIQLVPAPRLDSQEGLRYIVNRPAYYFHLPLDENRHSLKGIKQQGDLRTVNLRDAPTPTLEITAGSDLKLLVKANKPFHRKSSGTKQEQQGVWATSRVGGQTVTHDVRIVDVRTFELDLPNVRDRIDLDFRFRAEESVYGEQKAVVTVNSDLAPEIKQFRPHLVRILPDERARVTAGVAIPFLMAVADDFGLAGVDFVYRIEEDNEGEKKRRAARAAGALALVMSGADAPLTSYVYNLGLPALLAPTGKAITGRVPVAAFEAQFKKQAPLLAAKNFPGEFKLQATMLKRAGIDGQEVVLGAFKAEDASRLVLTVEGNERSLSKAEIESLEVKPAPEWSTLERLMGQPATLQSRTEKQFFVSRDEELDGYASIEKLIEQLAVKELEHAFSTKTKDVKVAEKQKILDEHAKRVEAYAPLKGFDLFENVNYVDQGVTRKLKSRPGEYQQTWLMTIWLEARDTNVERTPRGITESPRFTIEIVPDSTLLINLITDKLRLHDELAKIVGTLKKAHEEVREVRFTIPSPGSTGMPSYQALSSRLESAEKIVGQSKSDCTRISGDFRKILLEMRLNRFDDSRDEFAGLNGEFVGVRDNIVVPLWMIHSKAGYPLQLRDSGKMVEVGFDYCLEDLGGIRSMVDGVASGGTPKLKEMADAARYADERLEQVIQALNDILVQMGVVVELDTAKQKLLNIRQQEQESHIRLEALRKYLEDILIKQLTDDPKKDDPKKDEPKKDDSKKDDSKKDDKKDK